MRTAIFGFNGAGKSELFAALAGASAPRGNRAVVKVPEPRLKPLADLFKPKKITHAEIEYLDVPGGGKAQSLGERVLNEIRTCDCLLAVLDGFSGVSGPKDQYKAIEADLVISDMAVVEKRLERIKVDKKKIKDLVNPKEEEALLQAMEVLEAGQPLRRDPDLANAPELRGFALLSAKPILCAWNLEESKVSGFTRPEDAPGESHVAVSAKLERELIEIEDPNERALFLADLGLGESARDRVIAGTYKLLGLITFLTAGEKDVRAWTIKRGSKAQEAAGAIHSDIQKGFIRAEVLGWEDFEKAKDFKRAKDLGLLRLEGKGYPVQDGDIIEFRFNL